MSTEEKVELSKTAKKKIAKEAQTVAKNLAKLTKKQIEISDHPEIIKDELRNLSRIKSLPARMRHIKYIAKILLNQMEN